MLTIPISYFCFNSFKSKKKKKKKSVYACVVSPGPLLPPKKETVGGGLARGSWGF